MNCHNCKKEFNEADGYKVEYLKVTLPFCGRICLTEWIAPELKTVCVPRQWIPTPDEEERMRQ